MRACHACGEPWTEKRSPGHREECLRCGAVLHCCANCRFYDKNAAEWCREPAARREKPRDPVAGNICSWFVFGDRDSGVENRSAKAKSAIEDLFRPPG